jgi:hypothetical protein
LAHSSNQTVPEAIHIRSDRDISIATLKDIGGRPRLRSISASNLLIGYGYRVEREKRVHHRYIYVLTTASHVAVIQSRCDRRKAREPGTAVAEHASQEARNAIRLPVVGQHSTFRLGNDLDSAASYVVLGCLCSKQADRSCNEAGIRGSRLRKIEPEAHERARSKVLYDHIGGGDQLMRDT